MNDNYSDCATLKCGVNDNFEKTFQFGSIRFDKNLLKEHFAWIAFALDLVFIFTSLFVTDLLLTGSQLIEKRNISMSLLFIASWLLISALTNRFSYQFYQNFRDGIVKLLKTTAATIYLMTVLFILFGFYSHSRLQAFGSGAILLLLEILTFLAFCYFEKVKISLTKTDLQAAIHSRAHLSVKFLLLDFLTIAVIFLLIYYFNHHSIRLSDEYQKLLILYFSTWFIIGLFTRKFQRRNYKNIFYIIAPFLKSFFLMFSVLAVFVYGLHWYYFSRLQIFGSLSILLAIEFMGVIIYYFRGYTLNDDKDINSISEVKQILTDEAENDAATASTFKKAGVANPANIFLEEKFITRDKTLFKFLEKKIDLNLIDQDHVHVIGNQDVLELQTIENHSLRLFINLNRINDVRHINRYFLEVHRRIYNSGFFVGVAHTIETHEKWLRKRYPRWSYKIIHPLDFFFNRILPRLNFSSKMYFFFTKGKNQVLSKAEIFGRLYFCGFKVIGERNIANRLYFIAQRVKNPILEKNPSHGLIIQLKRIGYDGNLMYIRKFRTMHPYSEFLQEYIYEKNKLQTNGKFNEDFRVTKWGKLLRKLWIDELPQFVNFLQGDLSLVGVRALSRQYFNLYPEELKILRTKFKPGLVPPYYADLPHTLEEIINSEKKYLNQKATSPILTDFKYFWKAFYNIVIKKARSN